MIGVMQGQEIEILEYPTGDEILKLLNTTPNNWVTGAGGWSSEEKSGGNSVLQFWNFEFGEGLRLF